VFPGTPRLSEITMTHSLATGRGFLFDGLLLPVLGSRSALLWRGKQPDMERVLSGFRPHASRGCIGLSTAMSTARAHRRFVAIGARASARAHHGGDPERACRAGASSTAGLHELFMHVCAEADRLGLK
jgi:hypothetical protein